MSACEELVGRSKEPGDDIPDNGADHASKDDVNIDRVWINQLLADRFRYSGAKDKGGDEVEESRP